MNHKESLIIFPFALTFANALCGFLAVIKALDGEYQTAALFIVLAAIMDLFDGRLARMLGSASYLGKELDSLCDAVSFCFAPAIILYGWSLYELPRASLIVLGLYLCAGLFRLARFNVLADAQRLSFIGLPTPLAALFLTSLVTSHEWLSQSIFAAVTRPKYAAFVVVIIALLMISSLSFPSGKYFKVRLALGGLIAVLGVLTLWALWQGYPILLFYAPPISFQDL